MTPTPAVYGTPFITPTAAVEWGVISSGYTVLAPNGVFISAAIGAIAAFGLMRIAFTRIAFRYD